MIIQTFTSIEVDGLKHEWAVAIEHCKQEMKPVVPKFILVSNGYDEKNFIDYVDQVLTHEKPEKIIDGVNGGIADNYKEVGLWKIKYKN